MRRTAELLAPAGSLEALKAAVYSGADAVYLGAGSFNARQSAHNFNGDELREAVAFCHARGTAVHLTLNTLVREDEFADALALAKTACALGIDALIVQDRGLARAIHRAAPQMPLHASTQLSCHTPSGVRQLWEDGFSRVVLARELALEEIAACAAVGCETEVFVHGALCMCVSGQCFLSAMLGGRSGNRGRCAQPCRLPFSLDGKPTERDRALSLKDMSLCSSLQTLQEIGVCSFKIEGRMKRPEYVAAAVSVCRAALDSDPIDTQLAADLQAVFSRSGFTDGYLRGARDLTMFGSRTKEDVAAAAPALKRLQRLYDRERQHLPLTAALTLRTGEPLSLTLSDSDGHTVTATGEPPRTSEAPLPDERLYAQLQKLGGTPFRLEAEALTLHRDPTADVPLAALNTLRREAAAQLLALRAAPHAIPFCATDTRYAAVPLPASPAWVVRLASVQQVSAALQQNADLLVLPLSTPPKALSSLCAGGRVAVEIPRGLFGQQTQALAALRAAKSAGACAAVCHTADALSLSHEAGLPPLGGFGLHAFNRETLASLAEDGVRAATVSFELTARQASALDGAPIPLGAWVYGRQPLMLMRNCPRKAQKGCAGCGGDGSATLCDRTGARFPLMCAGGCTDLLNAVPLYLGDKRQSLFALSFYFLHMTDESAALAFDRLAACRRADPAQELFPTGSFTRGLTFRGVE